VGSMPQENTLTCSQTPEAVLAQVLLDEQGPILRRLSRHTQDWEVAKGAVRLYLGDHARAMAPYTWLLWGDVFRSYIAEGEPAPRTATDTRAESLCKK
jgi:hypothetical protein